MDIRVKATEYDITPEISAYLDERIRSIEKMLARDADTTRLEVELGRDAGRPRHGANIFFAEIRIITAGSPAIYARNNDATLNAAIDDVKEEVERQLRRSKKLHIRMYRKSGAWAKALLRLGD